MTTDTESDTGAPETTQANAEFEHVPVPTRHRRPLPSVAAVWFGFPMILTNAVFGGVIVYGLGFGAGILAILIGNLVLAVYVGTLSHLAGATGRNFGMIARTTFGSRGFVVASAFLSTVVIGWFAFQTGLTGSTLHSTLGWNETAMIALAGVLYIGVTAVGIRALAVLGAIAAPLFVVLGVIAISLAAAGGGLGGVLSYPGVTGGSAALTVGAAITITIAGFADSGTMTADFTRWARTGRQAAIASSSAFPLANFVAMGVGGVIVAAGAATDPAANGGDFLNLLVGHGPVLQVIAVAFVFINLGSVCTHCLYNGAVGWSHITGSRMRLLTVILGGVGLAAAVAGVWSLFETWLNVLGVFVPPIGAVIITDQVLLARRFAPRPDVAWRPDAFLSWAAGAAAAAAVHFIAPAYAEAIVGMIVAAAVYAVLRTAIGSSGGRAAVEQPAPAAREA